MLSQTVEHVDHLREFGKSDSAFEGGWEGIGSTSWLKTL